MSVMLCLLSWLLLVMGTGGGLHTNSATAEVTIPSNSAAVSAYWHKMLPNTSMPSAIIELLTPPAGDVEKGNYKLVGPPMTNWDNYRWGGPSTKNNIEKDNYKLPTTNGDNYRWGGPSTKNNIEKDKYKWRVGPPTTNGDNYRWGGPSTNDNIVKDNYNPPTTNGDNYRWGGPSTKNNIEKGKYKWGVGPPMTNGDKYRWGGPSTKNNIENDNYKPPKINGDNYRWGGPSTKNNIEKDNYKLGVGAPMTNGDNYRWGGPSIRKNIEKNNYKLGVGPPTTYGENYKWGSPSTEAGDQKTGPSTGGGYQKGDQKGVPLLEIGESHISHKHGTMSSKVFLEEALKPGSTITCYVLPSHTSGAPLLRRDVADSIPMSMRNFTDILRMFAPASNGMAAAIWSTMEECEHPEALKGETKACATSVESMVEFAASVLRVSTHNLRAFSSPDAPREGIMPGRRYRVAAATRVTQAEDTLTCHGGRFPFALFMCHSLNPTRVYSVTLEGGDDFGTSPRRMEVLAVCHLDTSGFDPTRMPPHLKPGDAPLCHFISRDSILWAPAALASA